MHKLLLHICCAPDATVAIERLRERYDITGYFYNPNIEPVTEYALREGEVRRLAGLQGFKHREEPSSHEEWYEACSPLASEPERGARCRVCISHRLKVTAIRAADYGCTHFTTTLTTSPHKDVEFIHAMGDTLAKEFGLIYLPETFRSQDGFRRSLALSREFDLYRQNYCGCRWSRHTLDMAVHNELKNLAKK